MNIREVPCLAYLSSELVDEGVVVEVLSAGPAVMEGPSWNCKSQIPVLCITDRSKREVTRTEMCVADRYLRPITGRPLDEETPVEHEVSA